MSKISRPRIPKKEGAIKFQFGWSDGEPDWLVLFGDNVPRCDRALIFNTFTSKRVGVNLTTMKPEYDDSFVDELKKRGYDINTLRFSIEKLAE